MICRCHAPRHPDQQPGAVDLSRKNATHAWSVRLSPPSSSFASSPASVADDYRWTGGGPRLGADHRVRWAPLHAETQPCRPQGRSARQAQAARAAKACALRAGRPTSRISRCPV